VNDLTDIALVLGMDILDTISNLLLFHDDVLHTHCETLVDQPVVNNFLHTAHIISTCLRAKVLDYHMVQALDRCTDD
jgi:hypothetical protein